MSTTVVSAKSKATERISRDSASVNVFGSRTIIISARYHRTCYTFTALYSTLRPSFRGNHPASSMNLCKARPGAGALTSLLPSATTSESCCSNYLFPTAVWLTRPNPLIFESLSSLPCRTIRTRPVPRWPATRSPKSSRVAIQSSRSPPCFRHKHERSEDSDEAMAELREH